MNKVKPFFKYFSPTEWILWSVSLVGIAVSFAVFDRENYQMLIASVIGITSLVLNAKGNPIGQILMIVFSVLYGMISYECRYYGEMITYLGMCAPIAVFSLVSWLRNPYKDKKLEVSVRTLKKAEIFLISVLTAIVTVAFYFILSALGNANIIPATISVTTSFLAASLTFRRSPYFALAYALNDIVLIILWTIVLIEDKSYFSVLICFVVFLINDTYGFVNWIRMRKRQNQKAEN